MVCEPAGQERPDPDLANRAFWQPMRGTTRWLSSKRNRFKVGFRTCRRSFASNLAARGVDQRIIDEWVGPQSEAMRKWHRHLIPKDRRTATQFFSFDRDIHDDKAAATHPTSIMRRTMTEMMRMCKRIL